MIELTCHVNHFFDLGNDIISLESRPLNFRVFIHAHGLQPQASNTHTKTVQKEIKSIDFDKIGCKKALARKFCFV